MGLAASEGHGDAKAPAPPLPGGAGPLPVPGAAVRGQGPSSGAVLTDQDTGPRAAVPSPGPGSDATVPGDAAPAPRAKRMPREVRERHMLDAAVHTFGRHGYRAASMDDIAELAGVSKPLVYLYLDSKESLFATCIRREARALMTALRAGVDPALPPERRLWEGLLAFFTHTAGHPDGWSVLHHQALTHGERFATEAAVLRAEVVSYVTALISATADDSGRCGDLDDSDLSCLAHALVGAAESLAEWAAADGSVSPAQAAGTLMSFAWHGLDRLVSGRRWTPPGA